MNNLVILERKNTVTSLELVEQINIFRSQEGNRSELQHNDLLKIIRDEFEEEISLGKISQSTYKNDRGREYPMFELTFNQGRQILVRESKFVRKHIIAYLDNLEQLANKPMTTQEILIATLQEQQKQAERIEVIESKVDNQIRIDYGEQVKVQKSVAARIYQRMDILNNHENSKLMFKALYRDLKSRFGVPSYKDIKRKDLKDALLYISTWIEPAELKVVA
ncbi:ORF6C domain-containing protein [Fusobacterium varium]|uniref:ORF6C domain-containing protein n=1 Tax=Fusobacterium TaxID=848 RepID=UPI0030D0ABC3